MSPHSGPRPRRRAVSPGAKRQAARRAPTVFVVSDGRGETCDQVLRAALVQFEGQPCRVASFPGVRDVDDVERIVGLARAERAVVFYTLVGSATREAMAEAARRRLFATVDVLGPGLSALHDLFKRVPRSTPGLLYASNREQFDRHAAIDYTLKHDDGQRPHELNLADVVLVGVSRAAKSTTCFYLAYEGVKAANVPLVPGLALPPQIFHVDPLKVVGLRVNVMRLITVREARAAHLNLSSSDPYVERRRVAREVLEANRTMERHGWRSIDASYMAVEEVAREVLRLRGMLRS